MLPGKWHIPFGQGLVCILKRPGVISGHRVFPENLADRFHHPVSLESSPRFGFQGFCGNGEICSGMGDPQACFTLFQHADRVQADQPQPLLDFFFLVSSVASSVPPAPLVLPLQPLLELPAPELSPLHALLPAQPLKVSVDPDIRLAMHRPASIFFRSLASIVPSCIVKGLTQTFLKRVKS